MAITESEFRRRLAAALTGTGLAACGEQGPAVSAVLAEARAAGLELAVDPAEKLEIQGDAAAGGRALCFRLIQSDVTPHLDGIRNATFEEAIRRYNAYPALEARDARLAAALGELLGTIEAIKIFDMTVEQSDRLRQVRAEARAALAEGGEVDHG